MGTLVFSSGYDRAVAYRNALLSELGAEPEWTYGGDGDQEIAWIAGPLATYFRVEAPEEDLPGLAGLTVRTITHEIKDLGAARQIAALLNAETSLNRWTIINDPGPEGWFDPQHPNAPWRNYVAQTPDQDSPISLGLSFSITVSEPSAEYSIAAVLLNIQEQIAKATAVATNYGDEDWGFVNSIAGTDGVRASEDWNGIVYHFDNNLAPDAQLSPQPLLDALNAGFRASVEAQHSEGTPSWHMAGEDQDGFTCEIPFGRGQYPLGVVTGFAISGVEGDQTCLVRGEQVPEGQNPLGAGLRITMDLPVDHTRFVAPGWIVHLLNLGGRIRSFHKSVFSSHTLGAWTNSEHGIYWSTFIPAYWVSFFEEGDLELLFAELLKNCARLSWGAHILFCTPLEEQGALSIEELSSTVSVQDDVIGRGTAHAPNESLSLYRKANAPGGFTAGVYSRGPFYGETGVGVDPGARLLNYAFSEMVSSDTQWFHKIETEGFGLQHGFLYQLSKRPVSVRTIPCHCDAPPDQGSLVTISTPVAENVSDEGLLMALAARSDGGCSRLLVENGLLQLCTTIHVHQDTLDVYKNWPAVISASQALFADQLHALLIEHGDLNCDNIYEGETRQDRDGVFDILNPDAEWNQRGFSDQALALAPHQTGFDIYQLRWDENDVVVGWGFPRESSSLPPVSKPTVIRQRLDPALGHVLEFTTAISLGDAIDSAHWCFEQNLTCRNSGVTSGCFSLKNKEVAFVSTYPISLSSGLANSDESAAVWIGSMLSYHFSIFAEIGLEEALSEKDLTAGLRALPDFYSRSFPVPDNLEGDYSSGTLSVLRPYSSFGKEWPRFGSYVNQTLRLELNEDTPFTVVVRCAHSAIHISLPPNPGVEIKKEYPPYQMVRVNQTLFDNGLDALPSNQLHNELLDALLNEELISATENGRPAITGLPEQVEAIFYLYPVDQHPAWGTAYVLEADITGAPGIPERTGLSTFLLLGEWVDAPNEGLTRFRMCLPPSLFAAPNAGHHFFLIKYFATTLIHEIQTAF